MQLNPHSNIRTKYNFRLTLNCNTLNVNILQINSTKAARENVKYGLEPKSFALNPIPWNTKLQIILFEILCNY